MFKALFDVLTRKNLLIEAIQLAEEALGKAKRVTDASFVALIENTPPDFDIYALDREINAAEVEVRRLVFEHLVARPHGDLTASVILISTIIDIERIGDYAKNLYEQTERLDTGWPKGAPFDAVPTMRNQLDEMFADTAQALRSADTELARSIMKRHAGLGQRCEAVLDDLCDVEGDFSHRQVVVAALAVRYVKRISAHLSNLASSVINPVDRIGFRPGGGPPTDADN